MESQSSVHERLNLLTRDEVIEILGYSISADGKCRQLERITNRKYCDKRGLKHLPHYFGGAKMMIDKDDLKNWMQQFKK